MTEWSRLQVAETCLESRLENRVPGTKKCPGVGRRGVSLGEREIRSVAAVHQPPARTPGGRNQPARIAAAISAAVIGWAADENARATPAVATMPAAMPAT